MENMQKIFDLMLHKEYFSERELRYGKKANLFLSGYDYRLLLDYKKALLDAKNPNLTELDLYAWVKSLSSLAIRAI